MRLSISWNLGAALVSRAPHVAAVLQKGPKHALNLRTLNLCMPSMSGWCSRLCRVLPAVFWGVSNMAAQPCACVNILTLKV